MKESMVDEIGELYTVKWVDAIATNGTSKIHSIWIFV